MTAAYRGKRLFDVTAASLALLVLTPFLLILALVVRLRLGSPVLFRQERPGKDGRPFLLYKFRTMLDLRDATGAPLPDEERLTPFGRALRATSLDELPELINVVKGDMSLVGPRPLLMEYLDEYTPEEARRHEVRPGIAGWTVVKGRNSLAWEEKFRLDVWYVDNASFLLDLKILFLTLFKVLRRDDVQATGHATMPRFTRGDR